MFSSFKLNRIMLDVCFAFNATTNGTHATTMLKKRIHNHNNNQTNPKKQPKPKTNPKNNHPANLCTQNTYNNNQKENTTIQNHQGFTNSNLQPLQNPNQRKHPRTQTKKCAITHNHTKNKPQRCPSYCVNGLLGKVEHSNH